MSYSSGEALVLSRLREVTGFTGTGASANTSRGDWSIRNSGVSDHYGILRRGVIKRSQIAMSANESTWETVIEVWQRYKDDGTSYTNLLTYCDSIIAYFDTKRKLGDSTNTILDAFISAGDEVQQMGAPGNDTPLWLRQNLRVTWKEYTEVTYAE